MSANHFIKVLTFFKNNRKLLFLLSAITYVVFYFIPRELINKIELIQCLFTLLFFGPFCLFWYFRWLDTQLSEKKRYFSRFLFFFFTFILVGNIILWVMFYFSENL